MLPRRTRGSRSSLQLDFQFSEAAGDPARDRAGREREGVADHLVALVPAEKAVEDLPAGLAERVQAGLDGQRLVERRERRVDLGRFVAFEVDRGLAAGGAELVDAEAP